RVAGGDTFDTTRYQVVRVYTATNSVPPGKYLVDPATREIRYVVDPGIGGRVREYQGRTLTRLDSPKATLMAFIADGILTHRLPWGLVLIGVFLAIAIELTGVQSLPVAVASISRSRRRRGCSPAGSCAGWWSGASAPTTAPSLTSSPGPACCSPAG